MNGSVPIKYGLRLNSESKYTDLKENLSKLCGIKPSCLLITELADSQIKHVMVDDAKIKQNSALELVAYELPESDDDQFTETRKQYQTFADIQRDAGKFILLQGINIKFSFIDIILYVFIFSLCFMCLIWMIFFTNLFTNVINFQIYHLPKVIRNRHLYHHQQL